MGRGQVLRHDGGAPLQVHVDAARVLLGGVLQAQLAADLLDLGFDLLDVVGGVVALADDAGKGPRGRCQRDIMYISAEGGGGGRKG